jgi:hypothetical protein
MPRIEYARNLVEIRTLPPVVPGDLTATSQVGDASNFIAHPTPLIFEQLQPKIYSPQKPVFVGTDPPKRPIPVVTFAYKFLG